MHLNSARDNAERGQAKRMEIEKDFHLFNDDEKFACECSGALKHKVRSTMALLISNYACEFEQSETKILGCSYSIWMHSTF